MVNRPGCSDVCGSKRWELDFQQLPLPDVLYLLKRNEMGINIMQSILVIAFVLWLLATGIPGFNLYDGAANTLNAYTHSMWWLVIQFIVIYVGASVTKYGLHYSVTDRVVEKAVSDTIIRMDFYMYLLGVGALAHIIHVVFMGIELNSCSSSLCNHYTWAFYFTLVTLAIHPFVHGWQIFRVMVYKANLNSAIKYDKIAFDVMGVPDEESGGPKINQPELPLNARVERIRASRKKHGFSAISSSGHKFK